MRVMTDANIVTTPGSSLLSENGQQDGERLKGEESARAQTREMENSAGPEEGN